MSKRSTAICLMVLCFSCSVPLLAVAGGMPVFVSIDPQKHFVQQIGGDLVDVQVMVRPGADPHTYEPKPNQMVALASARIYFAIGVPFEKNWLERFSAVNSEMLMVHSEQGIDKIPMAVHDHRDEDKQHGERAHRAEGEPGRAEPDHRHDGELDPHIWLSPPLVKVQARNILAALLQVDPANAAVYKANFAKFDARLDALDAQFKRIFAGKEGMEFMVFHPAWGYFAKTYELHQVPVEIEGKDPKPAQLMALIEHARNHGIKVVFVQPQFSSRSADMIARAIGGRVVFADPLAVDWAANLSQVATKFEDALK